MGKARILEAHGEGRYTIEIIEARERAEVAKKEAEARIQTLRANIAALEQRIASAQAMVNQAAAEQDAAINHYQQEIAEEGQSSINLDAFSRDLLEAASQRDALQAEQRTHELRITADEALVARINALPPLRQMQAWCADYTEDLSGEVATAEVPGEIGSVIIKPGFEGSAWSAVEDGAMQPTLASTPAATFYNLAMLPGWQKWRPTFRTATITRLDGDTCSITLNAATSSQQGLGVNAQASYSNVPILYMDCNGSAFKEGDQVLVAFAGNVEGPTVVGFEQAPKPCLLTQLLDIKQTRAFSPANQWWVAGEWENVIISGVSSARSRWRIITVGGGFIAEGGFNSATVNGETGLVMEGLPTRVEPPYLEIETGTLAPSSSGESYTSEPYYLGKYLNGPAQPEYADGGIWTLAVAFRSIPGEPLSERGWTSSSGGLVRADGTFGSDGSVTFGDDYFVGGEPLPYLMALHKAEDSRPFCRLEVGYSDVDGEMHWPER